MKTDRKSTPGGFSLIELLVSMFLLVVLVMISSRLFNTASQVWNTGTRKAEVNLIGRSVLDYLDREVSRAVFSTNVNSLYVNPTVSGNSLQYTVLSDNTNGQSMIGGVMELVKITLTGNTLMRGTNEIIRNIDGIVFKLDTADPDWPTFVDIAIQFKASEDRGTTGTNFLNTYAKRVYFPNYARSRYDDY